MYIEIQSGVQFIEVFNNKIHFSVHVPLIEVSL